MGANVVGRAYARAGLLGNPGDVYEGRVLAVSVRNFAATVRVEAAGRFEIVPGAAEALAFDGVEEAWRRLDEVGCDDGIRLLRAALRRFALHFPDLAEQAPRERLRFRLGYETEIPRQVGLSGSSAIVIAALRALAAWFGRRIPPFELSELALAAETQDLGITAGPMDRVIQAYEGALWMDFRSPRAPERYARLDPARLPPLLVAWDPRPGRSSGRAHAPVRQRWLAGDPEVRKAIARFAEIADEGRRCLEAGDHAGFRSCMDRNFDTRAAIWDLSERDRELVSLGRSRGAAVKMCGSGGAVIAAPAAADDGPGLIQAYEAAGYRCVVPRIAPESR